MEKKSDDGSLQDKDNRYGWSGECTGLNCTAPCHTDADCIAGTCDFVGHGLCEEYEPLVTAFEFVAELNSTRFAGLDDWRVPNVRELESLVNFENVNPATWGRSTPTAVRRRTAILAARR